MIDAAVRHLNALDPAPDVVLLSGDLVDEGSDAEYADIDPKRIFLLGYSYGATSSFFATDVKTPGAHDPQIAGVIAFYPYCYDNVVPSPPTLVLIGEQDRCASVGMCQAVKGNPNFDVVVYPGASHGFALAMGQPWVVHNVFDEKAALDAQQWTDAFMDAHMK